VLEPRSRIRVVITLRADFIDRSLQYVDFCELVQRRRAGVRREISGYRQRQWPDSNRVGRAQRGEAASWSAMPS
jgi:hypothetical protein